MWQHLDKSASLQKAVLSVHSRYLQKEDSDQHQPRKFIILPLCTFHQFNTGFIPSQHPDLGVVETFITVENTELSSD